ncbi:MAG: SDR family NAD(P)-dependent oxidoreductase [Bauldia sp.]
MQSDLNGRVAFVTGAAGGIGRAIAQRLSDNGARVVIADIDAAAAAAFAAELPAAIACRVDVTSRAEIDAGIAACLETYGRLDILINNAGINSRAHRVPIDSFPPEEWERIVGVDLDGMFLVSRAALPAMIAAGSGGRVVNIASIVGLAAMRLQSAYVAAKAGVVHLTRSMALELGPRGILVNAVAPGSTLTAATMQLFYGPNGELLGQAQSLMDHIPLGRPAKPAEIAEAVLFLSAPEASYITGQTLAVDGGWTAGYMM